MYNKHRHTHTNVVHKKKIKGMGEVYQVMEDGKKDEQILSDK